MRKILLSLIAVVAMTSGLVVGTRAYFSDTETSVGNTITAGTINISVNEKDPWDEVLLSDQLDVKPGMSKTATFTVRNEGANDLVLWKKIKATHNNSVMNEPKCEALPEGEWITEEETPPYCSVSATEDIATQMHYDMTVGGVNTIPVAWRVMMSDVNDLWIPLGKLAPSVSLKVDQVYKLDENAGNEYQGDVLTFDIELYAEQIGGPGPKHTTRGVVLENKDSNFTPIMDNTWGLLTFDMSTGNYRLRAWNLTGPQHQLQAWNSVTDSHIAYFGPIKTGSNLDYSDNYNFSANTNVKYWLRENSVWNNADTLWESNLVN